MVKSLLLFSFLVLGTVAQSAVAKSSDLSTMNQARSLYENNKLEKAIELYKTIKPNSDFWLESIEERAWAKTRLGQFEPALADLKSIASSVWSSQVGPETYMLSTFVSLKICAFKDVSKKISIFKREVSPRVDILEKLKNGEVSEAQWTVLAQLKDSQLNMVNLGKLVDQFPRYFFRDKELASYSKANDRDKMKSRLQALAASDLDEIELNLKKMKIMEVELIQNVMTMDESSKSKKERLAFEKVDKNKAISFPISNDEVWLDEVGHYQVKAQKCPYNTAGVKL